MPAFQGAVDLGFRYIETDVHATADGVLVAFHDDRLDRVTDRKGKISELLWTDVSQALVDSKEPIPRFRELLASFSDLKINIDPKADNAVAPLMDELREFDALGRVCIGSFSDARLKAFYDAFGSEVCLSMGPIEVAKARLSSFGFPIRNFRARAAQVPVRQGPLRVVDARFVARMHSLGIAVHCWTIDDPSEMRRLLDLGVDGIMTDLPEVLLAVLRERDLWPKED